MSKILIVDDDTAICRTLEVHFSSMNHEVLVAHNASNGLSIAEACMPDVIILDIRMSGQTGLEALPQFRQHVPDARVIMITAFHDMNSTIEAMQSGADDYIHKPIDLDELNAAVGKALQYQKFSRDYIELDPDDDSSSNLMAGHSNAMKEIFKTIGRIANSAATVLITGESGTGKDLVARAIHKAGSNRDGPFVAVNCAALVETLLESDMFGHEKGAFTGAVTKQLGKFTQADNGTIFLDEIGELSPTIQAKLLRVLQDKQFTPVGAKAPQTTNARVIAATNVDLASASEEGEFRHDLFYRLQVINIHIPSLRERREDIPALIKTLLCKINRESGSQINRIAVDAMDSLLAYHWPGNVRELENTLIKTVAQCTDNIITIDQLPTHITGSDGQASAICPLAATSSPIGQSLEDAEKANIALVLEDTKWHKGHACERLGITRPRLRRLIEKYGLVPGSGSINDDTTEELS